MLFDKVSTSKPNGRRQCNFHEKIFKKIIREVKGLIDLKLFDTHPMSILLFLEERKYAEHCRSCKQERVRLEVTRRSRSEQEVEENFGPNCTGGARTSELAKQIRSFWSSAVLVETIRRLAARTGPIGTTASRHFPLEVMYLTNRDARLSLMRPKR